MHISIENNFHLENRTVRHAPPKLTKTLRVLQDYIAKKKSHTFKPGRKVSYAVPNKLRDGLAKAEKELDEDLHSLLATYEEEGEVAVEADDMIDD